MAPVLERLRPLSRRLKRWLIVLAALLLVGIAFIWSLPEIVKWQALKQIPAITGRVAAIEDIDINLFTGRVAIKKFRLAEADPAQTFVEFERFDVRVIPWSSVLGNVRVAELRLTAPTVNLVRLTPTEFNFSDILRKLATAKEGAPPPPPPDPNAKSRWTIALDHLALIRANITVTDRAVKPTGDWKVRDLTIEAGNLTTRPSGPVGSLAVRAALNDSPVEFSARDIDLTPTSFAGKFSIQNFGLIQVVPYLAPMPAVLDSGVAGVDIAVKLELGKGPSGLAVGLVTGDLALTSLALSQPGKPAPFLTVPRIAVGLKEVNLVSREVAISSVDIEGVDLKATRDKQERIDLLGLAEKPASPDPLGSPSAAPRKATAAPPAASGPNAASGPPAAKGEPEFKVTVEKVTLTAAATFTDESVSTPPTVLKVSNLAVQLDDVTWPNVRPINLTIGLNPPGGGKIGAIPALSRPPLTRTEARDLLGESVEDSAANELYEETGGNPFYLEQLARSLRQVSAAGSAAQPSLTGLDVPAAVAGALAAEFALLGVEARLVLQGAAVAGDPFEPELAAAAAAVPEALALEALDALLGLDLIRETDVPRRFRFRHPLVRRAVDESTPAGWRLGAHERCAAALEARGALAAERATT